MFDDGSVYVSGVIEDNEEFDDEFDSEQEEINESRLGIEREFRQLDTKGERIIKMRYF